MSHRGRSSNKVRNRDSNLPQMPKPGLNAGPSSQRASTRGSQNKRSSGILGRSANPTTRSRAPSDKTKNAWFGKSASEKEISSRPPPTSAPKSSPPSQEKIPPAEKIRPASPQQTKEMNNTPPSTSRTETNAQSMGWDAFDDSDDDLFGIELSAPTSRVSPTKKPAWQKGSKPNKVKQQQQPTATRRNNTSAPTTSKKTSSPPRQQTTGTRGGGRPVVSRNRPPVQRQQSPQRNPWSGGRPKGNIPTSNFFSRGDEDAGVENHDVGDEDERERQPVVAHPPPTGPSDIPPVVREILTNDNSTRGGMRGPRGRRGGRGGRGRGRGRGRRTDSFDDGEDDRFYGRRDIDDDSRFYEDNRRDVDQIVKIRRAPKLKTKLERRFASSPCDAQQPKLDPLRRDLYRRRLVEVQERRRRDKDRERAVSERRQMLKEKRKSEWLEKLEAMRLGHRIGMTSGTSSISGSGEIGVITLHSPQQQPMGMDVQGVNQTAPPLRGLQSRQSMEFDEGNVLTVGPAVSITAPTGVIGSVQDQTLTAATMLPRRLGGNMKDWQGQQQQQQSAVTVVPQQNVQQATAAGTMQAGEDWRTGMDGGIARQMSGGSTLGAATTPIGMMPTASALAAAIPGGLGANGMSMPGTTNHHAAQAFPGFQTTPQAFGAELASSHQQQQANGMASYYQYYYPQAAAQHELHSRLSPHQAQQQTQQGTGQSQQAVPSSSGLSANAQAFQPSYATYGGMTYDQSAAYYQSDPQQQAYNLQMGYHHDGGYANPYAMAAQQHMRPGMGDVMAQQQQAHHASQQAFYGHGSMGGQAHHGMTHQQHGHLTSQQQFGA